MAAPIHVGVSVSKHERTPNLTSTTHNPQPTTHKPQTIWRLALVWRDPSLRFQLDWLIRNPNAKALLPSPTLPVLCCAVLYCFAHCCKVCCWFRLAHLSYTHTRPSCLHRSTCTYCSLLVLPVLWLFALRVPVRQCHCPRHPPCRAGFRCWTSSHKDQSSIIPRRADQVLPTPLPPPIIVDSSPSRAPDAWIA